MLLVTRAPAAAQDTKPHAPGPKPIQDNSFLLEEAYNQEDAVIQHISSMLFDQKSSTWLYSLTDEWPVNGQRHQLSLTVPLSHVAPVGTGLGDVALNYRLQLVGSGETKLAVTPRVTLMFPTTASKFGKTDFAMQGALASSYVAAPRLVLHTNAGFTYLPSSAGTSLLHVNAGQSAIWLIHPRVNLMLEAVVENREYAIGGTTERRTGVTLSPGVRWAYNFDSMGDLQIVPGIAFPFGFKAYDGQRTVLLYLSFEHELGILKRQ